MSSEAVPVLSEVIVADDSVWRETMPNEAVLVVSEVIVVSATGLIIDSLVTVHL